MPAGSGVKGRACDNKYRVYDKEIAEIAMSKLGESGAEVVTARRRVLFVCYHAYPDPEVGARRVSESANHFAHAGWEVAFISGQFRELSNSEVLDPSIRVVPVALRPTLYSTLFRYFVPSFLRSSHQDKLRVEQQDMTPNQSPKPISPIYRAIRAARNVYHQVVDAIDNYKRWALAATPAIWREISDCRPDVVICSCPPFSPSLPVSLHCRLFGVPLILDLRDPWSDLATLGFSVDSVFTRSIDRACERFVLKSASAVVVTTIKYQRRLLNRYSECVNAPFVCIRNGFDPVHIINEAPPVGGLSMLFAGTIYFNRNPMPFLAALRDSISAKAIDGSKIRVEFVGNCREWNGINLATWVMENGLGNIVTFSGLLSTRDLIERVKSANVLLNFAQGQKEQLPAKVFEQVAARRHLLVFCERDSETGELLSDYPLARILGDDVQEISAAIEELYNLFSTRDTLTADTTDIQKYSRVTGLKEYVTLAGSLKASS